MSSSSEHLDIGGLSIDDGILEGARFTDLPRELMFKIFGYLYEDDLAQCTLVSRKFRAIANHRALWEPLYQEVFEYSLPLLHVGHAQFEFREPHDWPQLRSTSLVVPVQMVAANDGANDDESIVVNPWKESFKQLKNGVHVRPGYASLYSGFGAGGRHLTQCDQLDQALRLVKTRGKNAEKLIFLHTSLYLSKTTVTINSDIQIIGASAGPDIASRVIIEGQLDTTVALAEGSQAAYLGWMTVRFAPDPRVMAAAIAAGNPHARIHYALQICGDSTALVEHCIIHSSAIGWPAVCVKGSAANPKMRHCVVCDCEHVSIHVTDAAQGQFEDCEIARSNGSGVLVEDGASPFFRRCHIHDGRDVGIFTFDHGMGYFESCNIYNNRFAGIEVREAANPTVTRCEVHHGRQGGIHVHTEGQGQFLENRIHSNAVAGIVIALHSDPKITCNKIWGNQGGGVLISHKGRGVLEDNDIYRNAQAGVIISFESNPTLRRNRVYEGRAAGIEIGKGAMATLESNTIFRNRFGGLCLATGVQPTLRDNKIYDNDDLMEKVIAKGGCLFEITLCTSFAMHDYYRCDTCNTAEWDSICLNCIRTCHAGHTVHLVRYDSFFCDCGAGRLKHQCKLWSEARDDSALPVDSAPQ